MSKSPAKPAPNAAAPVGRNHPLRWVVAVALLISLVLIAGRALWVHVRAQVLADPQYHLQSDQVRASTPPAWIKADVRDEVLRSVMIDGGLSVLDDDLLPRLTKAFQLHPWVAKVVRIEKRVPASVVVELEYRQPVCMVEVPGGLYPVDREAVLLPSTDFTPQEALAYPRLARIDKVTEGPVGTRWHDPQVEGAALLAEVLLPVWNQSRLKLIVANRDAALDRSRQGFELRGVNGARYLWGSPPGSEAAGELNASDKVQRLAQLASAPRDSGSAEVYDLRYATAVVNRPADPAAR